MTPKARFTFTRLFYHGRAGHREGNCWWCFTDGYEVHGEFEFRSLPHRVFGWYRSIAEVAKEKNSPVLTAAPFTSRCGQRVKS
jgi:hypothetical protein